MEDAVELDGVCGSHSGGEHWLEEKRMYLLSGIRENEMDCGVFGNW